MTKDAPFTPTTQEITRILKALSGVTGDKD